MLILMLACQSAPEGPVSLDPVAMTDERLHLTQATMAFDVLSLVSCDGSKLALPQDRPADLLVPRPIEIEAGAWCGLELQFSSGAGLGISGITDQGTPFRYSVTPQSVLVDQPFEAQGSMSLVLELSKVIPVTALDEAAIKGPSDPLDFGVQSPESIDLSMMLASSFVIQAG